MAERSHAGGPQVDPSWREVGSTVQTLSPPPSVIPRDRTQVLSSRLVIRLNMLEPGSVPSMFRSFARRVTTAHRVTCLAIAAAAGGCAVGPDYTTPASSINDSWLDRPAGPAGEGSLVYQEHAQWWKSFNDESLNRLVDAASKQNLSLRAAGLRVIQARAQRGIAVGQFFPQSQSANGGIDNNRISRNTAAGTRGDRSYADESLGLQAAWELDFWGKFRRGIESADASLLSQVADYDTIMVSVIADTASNYVLIRSLQERLAFARANVALQQDTLNLTDIRFKAGAVSELDVATARATLATTQSLIPLLEDSLRSTTLALCVLLGQTPSQLADFLGPASVVPQVPAEIASGVPADLLKRRPDIRRAERLAASISEQIGIAKADFFPSVSIAGRTSFRTSNFDPGSGLRPGLNNLFDANSFDGFVGLSFNWPILNYGRIENNVRVQDARFQQAIVQYQQTVLGAAAEVEAGLSSFLRNRERTTFLAESADAAKRAVELSAVQYRAGAIDFIRLNDAQSRLTEQQDALADSRARAAIGAISTFRALGGGWQVRGEGEFVNEETARQMRDRTNWGDVLGPGYDQGKDLGFPRAQSGFVAPTTSGDR